MSDHIYTRLGQKIGMPLVLLKQHWLPFTKIVSQNQNSSAVDQILAQSDPKEILTFQENEFRVVVLRQSASAPRKRRNVVASSFFEENNNKDENNDAVAAILILEDVLDKETCTETEAAVCFSDNVTVTSEEYRKTGRQMTGSIIHSAVDVAPPVVGEDACRVLQRQEEHCHRPQVDSLLLTSLPSVVLIEGVLPYLRPKEIALLGACSKNAKAAVEEGSGHLWQSVFLNEWKREQRRQHQKYQNTAMRSVGEC